MIEESRSNCLSDRFAFFSALSKGAPSFGLLLFCVELIVDGQFEPVHDLYELILGVEGSLE